MEQVLDYDSRTFFNTVDEEEDTLPADAMIGLVQPMEMSKQLLTARKEQLTFSGCSVSYSNEDVSCPDDTCHAQRCAPNEVSERYFSEVILQIAGIVGE